MKIGFLITARLKSTRLPLKLLKPLNGYTVIERVIQRAKQVIECDDVILCTSKNNQDLPLLRLAQSNNIYYFNGESEDVLQRLLDASELFGLDYFIGITADNPLFSIYHANLISDQIRLDQTIDFLYTVDMPIGVNIYAINVKALKTVCFIKKEMNTEIWGYLVNRPEIFNVKKMDVEKGYRFEQLKRLTLDEYDDYRLFQIIFNSFKKNDVIDILDVYKLLEDMPKLLELNRHIEQLDLDTETKLRIDGFYKENHNKILELKQSIYQ